eukprot:COSAG01_NODE_4981_length_4573_cov_2.672105_2_plen_1101_part_00
MLRQLQTQEHVYALPVLLVVYLTYAANFHGTGVVYAQQPKKCTCEKGQTPIRPIRPLISAESAVCKYYPATRCGCADPTLANLNTPTKQVNASCEYRSLCSQVGWTCYIGACASTRCKPQPRKGIYTFRTRDVVVRMRSFSGLSAQLRQTIWGFGFSGGAIHSHSWYQPGSKIYGDGGTLVISYCSFADNIATLASRVGNARLAMCGKCKFKTCNCHDLAYTGGAIYKQAGLLDISHSSFDRNTAKSRGGAIMIYHALTTVSYSSFDKNTATRGAGGAIYVGGGTLVVSHASFVANTALSSSGADDLGSGGAIFVGSGALGLFYSSFRDNAAEQRADHIRLSPRCRRVKIFNSTLTPLVAWAVEPGKSVILSGTPVGCEHHPCAAGHRCSYRRYSLFCSPCPEGTVGRDGLACMQCPPGQQPNRNRTHCVRCTGSAYSQFGARCATCADVIDSGHTSCTKCQPGEQPNSNRTHCDKCTGSTYSQFGVQCVSCSDVVDSGRTTCTPCADGLQPNRLSTACLCKRGRFNRSKDTHCFENDYRSLSPFVRECVPCEQLNVGEPCVDAQRSNDSHFSVKDGWLQLVRDDGIRSSIFQCNHETACLDNRCSPGYTGPLCGVCVEGYSRGSGGQCTACGASTWIIAVVLSLVLMVGLAALLTVDRWHSYFSVLQEIAGHMDELELKAILKILVATMQIVSAFANALNLQMPYDFRRLLQMLAVFRFDFIGVVGLGCVLDDSYATSLAAKFTLVATVVTLSVVAWAVERNKAPDESKLRQFFGAMDEDDQGLTVDEIVDVVHRVDASVGREHVQSMFAQADADGSERLSFSEFDVVYRQDSGLGALLRKARRTRSRNDALGRVFLLVFLAYPGLTCRIFDIFSCRDLGPDTIPGSVLHADYGVDCDSTWGWRNGLGVVLVLLWPIGIPAALLMSMLRHRKSIVAQDSETTRMFFFIVADYRVECWYWEVVELARKLLLSGLISVLGRGSVAQAAMAALISFFFFAVTVNAKPFKSRTLNGIKIFSEVQLFVVLQVCVILQTKGDLSSEAITAEGYGVLQTIATLSLLPIIVGLVAYNVQRLTCERAHHADQIMNPVHDQESDTPVAD